MCSPRPRARVRTVTAPIAATAAAGPWHPPAVVGPRGSTPAAGSVSPDDDGGSGMTVDDAQALLTSITDLGRRVLGAAACSLALLEPDEEHLRFRCASGVGADEVVGLRLPVGRGIAGWVVSSGQPIAVHDVRADPRFAVDVAESTGYVPGSILAVPLVASGEALGVIEVLDRTPVDGRDDLELLTLLATQAAIAVELTEAASSRKAAPADPASVFAEAARLGPAEQRAAAALLSDFLAYLGHRGGPAGLV